MRFCVSISDKPKLLKICTDPHAMRNCPGEDWYNLGTCSWHMMTPIIRLAGAQEASNFCSTEKPVFDESVAGKKKKNKWEKDYDKKHKCEQRFSDEHIGNGHDLPKLYHGVWFNY